MKTHHTKAVRIAHYFVAPFLLAGLLSGCIVREPEGPAERIGKGIDAITTVFDDIDKKNAEHPEREDSYARGRRPAEETASRHRGLDRPSADQATADREYWDRDADLDRDRDGEPTFGRGSDPRDRRPSDEYDDRGLNDREFGRDDPLSERRY